MHEEMAECRSRHALLSSLSLSNDIESVVLKECESIIDYAKKTTVPKLGCVLYQETSDIGSTRKDEEEKRKPFLYPSAPFLSLSFIDRWS